MIVIISAFFFDILVKYYWLGLLWVRLGVVCQARTWQVYSPPTWMGKSPGHPLYSTQKFSYFSLEFGTSPSTEVGAPPVFTNDILSMISPEKESVPLLKVNDVIIIIIITIIIIIASESSGQC